MRAQRPRGWLPLLILAAALAAIAADWLQLRPLLTVFKPLCTGLIIAFAWPRGRGRVGEPGEPGDSGQPLTRPWLLGGLAFSLFGDVALLWPEQGFIFGLLGFLAAHLCYLWAFSRVHRLGAWPWPFVAYGVFAAAVLHRLWPGVPAALQAPVLVYVLCLTAMGAQAAVLAWRARATAQARAGWLLGLGGLLFVISDTLLASNKFAGPLPHAGAWVLSSYWAAQFCIASYLSPAPCSRPTCP